MAVKRKAITKSFRLTEEDAREFSHLAEEQGMNESELLRILIRQKPKDYPEIRILLRKLIVEVNRIGTNVNQITHNYNSGFYTLEDKRMLNAYMQKLNDRMDEAVREIGNL